MDTVHASNGDRHDAVEQQLERYIEESDTPELAKRTLRRVNKIRRFFGADPLLDLRKGVPGDSRNCPVYNSLTDLNGALITSVGTAVVLGLPNDEALVHVGIGAQKLHEAIDGDEIIINKSGYDIEIITNEVTEFIDEFDGHATEEGSAFSRYIEPQEVGAEY